MELPTAAVRPARPGRHRRGAHPEEKAVRAAVRQLCAERIEPHGAGWFERGRIDDVRGLAKELGALGVLGMHLEGYGCAGMSATEYGLACLELEAADSGIRCLVSVQGSLAMFTLWRWGSAEQKAGQHPVRGQHRPERSAELPQRSPVRDHLGPARRWPPRCLTPATGSSSAARSPGSS